MASVDIEPATRENATDVLDLQRLACQSEAELHGDWSIPPLVQTLAELTAEFGRCLFLNASQAGWVKPAPTHRPQGTASLPRKPAWRVCAVA